MSTAPPRNGFDSMPLRRRLLLILVALLAPEALVGQEAAAAPRLDLDAIELSLGGRVQTQFATTSVETVPGSQLVIRRARLEIGVKVSEIVSGALQPDFAGDEVELKDAYLRLDLSPALQLLAGKAHRPFGLLEQTSSKRMLPIERGLRIRGLEAADGYALLSGLGYSNRDIGLQLRGAPRGAPLGLAYAAGVFRGPQHQVGNEAFYQAAARATIRPAAELRLGAGWSNRAFAEAPLVPGGAVPAERGNAFEIDAEYGSFGPGFHLLAELARGDLDPATGATFRAAQTWLAYRTGVVAGVPAALEPVLRVSHSETDGAGRGAVVPGGTLVTPGINVYFGPLNRVMLNYDLWLGSGGSPNAQSFKAMFQLGF